MRILVAEDDAELADGLCRALRQSDYAVDHAANGKQADAWLKKENYDLAILDLGLPGLNGMEVLRRLRRREQPVPVLILTALDALEDRVQGLDLGADDYVVKPIAYAELEARIRALIRRSQGKLNPQLRHGPLMLDTVGKRAYLDDQPIDLSAREWAVLEFFLLRAGRIVSKEQLLQALCGWDEEITPNAIEQYVSRLRAKLEPAGIVISTVRGLGYYLEKFDS
ncbi:transcriptional regulator [Sulfuricella sp. T08]|uniref:response regulator n=1 Tax=Sulfuricella sp. T08 TaxID=1632857 RepID=UPI0006179964|nr:response regulator transcription factor [Sulfuricella sp. T08]GAO37364.1 transcriptional regulator [Sulfuricella sp. T08]